MNLDEALHVLATFERRAKQLAEDQKRVISAKEALGMECADVDRLAGPMAELNGLKETWTLVRGVRQSLSELLATPWFNVVPPKVRSSLDDILKGLRAMPSAAFTSQAWIHTHETVKRYKTALQLVNDLRSDALKERHWKTVRTTTEPVMCNARGACV